MPSIIPGFEYDIFISYRQKDNRGERWVSEFVDALKDELESTFKEEISVYFDVNPHEGILENHDVGDSLKEKLKCLIFIPVLSRTYCDPKSFAWEHEFVSFIDQASKDQFGLKVKLPGGNVASRVLPVRIHDLDNSDIALCEAVTGGVLRGVEFIYKSPGVNRPLRPDEEKVRDNINNTIYRDQINKVALAIKDIILGLKSGSVFPVIESDLKKEEIAEAIKAKVNKPAELHSGNLWSKIVPAAAFIFLLVITAFIVFPKIFKTEGGPIARSADKRISVAVLPFQNMTNDKKLDAMELGIQDELINYLTNAEELKVDPADRINSLLKKQGLNSFAPVSPATESKISSKLGADVYISGGINESGSTIRINITLTDSKTREVLRAFNNEGPSGEVSIYSIIVPLKEEIKNFLIIKGLKEEVYIDPQRTGSSDSPDAYKAFNIGQKAFANGDLSDAINYLKQAVGYDSNLVYATLHVGWAYFNLGNYDEAKAWCLKAYCRKDQMSQELSIYTDFVHAFFFETPYEAIKYLKRLRDIDDQWPHLYYDMGVSYIILEQYERAIPEFNRALDMYREKGLKPWWAANYFMPGIAYHKTGQFKEERKLYKKATLDFPENPFIIRRMAILAFSEGKSNEAEKLVEQYKAIRKENATTEAIIISDVASLYSEAQILGKAELYYRQVLSLQPADPNTIYNLAWFLIDKNVNINEGVELIEKALKQQPDNYLFLDSKGWGFFKQGKYMEAHILLQKADSLKPVYSHPIHLRLEEAKKAVARQK